MANSCVYKSVRRGSRCKMPQVYGFLVLASILGSALPVRAAENSAASAYGCVNNQGQLDVSFGYLCQSGGSRLLAAPQGFVFHTEASVLKGQFVGSTNTPVEPAALVGARANFLSGNNPQKWRTGVPVYSQLVQGQIYPGADLRYESAPDHFQVGFE